MVKNTHLQMISLFIALGGGAFWLVYGVLGTDVHYSLRIAGILVGIISIYMMFDRNVYLPFLGETAFPAQLLANSASGASVDVGKTNNMLVKLKDIPSNTTVVYWAANKIKDAEVKYWKDAYGDYQNSGVVKSDENGEVSFSIACPQSYYVNVLGLVKKTIPPHLHYRYVLPGTNGSMFSEVRTVPVLC